jgi:hypothetical protein
VPLEALVVLLGEQVQHRGAQDCRLL